MARGRRLEPRDLICSGDYPKRHRVQGGLPGWPKIENRIGKKTSQDEEEKNRRLARPARPGLVNEGRDNRGQIITEED